jgi:transposase
MSCPPGHDSRDEAAPVAGDVASVIAALRKENAALREQNAALQILATLAAQLEILTAQQQAVIAQQQVRIAELERQVGLNSGNSGKPPSSDGLKKKPVRVSSLRERSGKKPGGQKGHPGETLRRSETPDVTIDHFPETCAGCSESLSAAMATDHVARQVFDLPEPQPLIVTEHRAHSCCCAACGTQTRANFPDHVKAPVQYGARIAGIVVYLMHYQFLPQKRLAALMDDLFGVQLTTATIAAMSQNCAVRFTSFATALYARIAAAAVKHLDETGFRIGGNASRSPQHQWLHIAATVWLTFYRISPKRGDMPENLTGIAVHDHWKPYYTLEGIKHALCNAHHLRELKALVEIEKEDWARKMQRLLRRGCHATNLARESGKPSLPPRLIALFERRYDVILAEGLAFHAAQPALVRAQPKGKGKARGRKPRRVGHNLLLRLSIRKGDVLRFLSDLTVPFTNNVAEQAARMMKLRQKISGGFRSVAGAADFAVIRSLLATARKQGWKMLDTLATDPTRLLADLKSA